MFLVVGICLLRYLPVWEHCPPKHPIKPPNSHSPSVHAMHHHQKTCMPMCLPLPAALLPTLYSPALLRYNSRTPWGGSSEKAHCAHVSSFREDGRCSRYLWGATRKSDFPTYASSFLGWLFFSVFDSVERKVGLYWCSMSCIIRIMLTVILQCRRPAAPHSAMMASCSEYLTVGWCPPAVAVVGLCIEAACAKSDLPDIPSLGRRLSGHSEAGTTSVSDALMRILSSTATMSFISCKRAVSDTPRPRRTQCQWVCTALFQSRAAPKHICCAGSC